MSTASSGTSFSNSNLPAVIFISCVVSSISVNRLAIFVIGLLFILLGPYYMLTKTPTVEQGGDYRIDNIEGKEDWPKTE